MSYFIKNRANQILKQAYGPKATFREGQLEAIISVVEKRKTLVIQKTGWGKSIVYFIATKILIEDGAGPSIIVSPLLALMKNQVDSAAKLGINAITINSDTRDDWDYIYTKLNSYDAIIISPERLSNERFMENLSSVKNIELFVVDEAHSISDWGHDFRPDYQRIVNLIDQFPSDIAILGTTATANNRVVSDIKNQLGNDLFVVRGDLIRDKLAIQINPIQSREERLEWLTHNLLHDERLKNGQGIIYCLTQRDCEIVTGFLKKHNISAEAYHSGLGKDSLNNDIAPQRIEGFNVGKIRILVATIKLGMGYDKLDIRFIIHYQLPQNLISYYQQIGRAGRDGNLAYALLLHGTEDQDTLDFFIRGVQAKPELLEDIMNIVQSGEILNYMLLMININRSKLLEALKYLSVHEHIYKDGTIYRRNIHSTFNTETERTKQIALNTTRVNELENLKEYLHINTCYMKFVADELDAPDTKTSCGICAICLGHPIIPTNIHSDHLLGATAYLKNKHGKVEPRKQWGTGGNIPESLRFKAGWILSDDYYSEVGKKVKEDKYTNNRFSNELVTLSVGFIQQKVSNENIDLVVAVPSLRRADLVPDFAERLSQLLSLPFENAVIKTDIAVEQKTLLNSAQQQENIKDSITIDLHKVFGKTILLVDDMVDSRWSFTIIATKLLSAGAKAVYPFALVKTGKGD